jgi:hypothetical protein
MSDAPEPIVMARPDVPVIIVHERAWVMLSVVWHYPHAFFESRFLVGMN